MKDRDVTIATKVIIAETMIFPIVTYGSERWTVRKKDRKKIDAFELWTWRRILGTPLTDRRTNLSILEEMKPKRSLEAKSPSIKATLLRPCNENKRVTGTGHHAWTS